MLVGNECEGFKIMAEMMNLSRLYNSIAALAVSRRALIEAYQFLCHRISFGRLAVEHPLVRIKLEELAAIHTANFYLVWRAIRALDLADNGDQSEQALLRLLTPMIKKHTAETGVYLVRESMELMGGIGYIEDLVMPRLMRDVLVLPIWEGAGNIMLLDMLRASLKSKGLEVMFKEIELSSKTNSRYCVGMLDELVSLKSMHAEISSSDTETMESSAKPFFERLTNLFSKSVLIQAKQPETLAWIEPSLQYFCERKNTISLIPPLKINQVKDMMGWNF
jgi:acyl-CoA dehydrogenase